MIIDVIIIEEKWVTGNGNIQSGKKEVQYVAQYPDTSV